MNYKPAKKKKKKKLIKKIYIKLGLKVCSLHGLVNKIGQNGKKKKKKKKKKKN